MFQLNALANAWPVEWYGEIDSTSALAGRRAVDGVQEPVWCAAKAQTAGRVRLGRKWISETGNLYTTALIPIDGFSPAVAGVSLSIGLAVRDMVIELSQGRLIPGLKWPNDVRIDGAKLSGILLESGRSSQTKQFWLSIGIGINLAFAPDIPDYATVSLTEVLPDLAVPPETALVVLDGCLRKRLTQFSQFGMSSVIDDWMKATDQIGAICRSKLGDQTIEGEFHGLDEHGHMCLNTSTGEVVTITAGDVELVKER